MLGYEASAALIRFRLDSDRKRRQARMLAQRGSAGAANLIRALTV